MSFTKNITSFFKLGLLCAIPLAACVISGWHFSQKTKLPEVATAPAENPPPEEINDPAIEPELKLEPVIKPEDLPAAEAQWAPLPSPPSFTSEQPPKPTAASEPAQAAQVIEEQPQVEIANIDDATGYLTELNINGMGPKGIVIDDDHFVEWGGTLDPSGKITLLEKKDRTVYFRAFNQVISKRF